MIAANGFAQGVIDVHSHLITPEFVSTLENEGRLMDEGFPLPKYKQGTLHMVKDLKLPTMKPLDPKTMKLIFKKQR